jgi:lipoyl(octanoyl) transferase
MPDRPFPPEIVQRGIEPYAVTFAAMQAYTDQRIATTADQIWLVEHPPVYTLGLGADPAHILDAHNIPIIQTDRGGEVTYHGHGQVVAYLMLDLRRHKSDGKLFARELVFKIEQAVIDTLAAYNLACERKPGAPGIYVSDGPFEGAKIAALGLKIRGNGCTYHGVSLNVAMDLIPFSWINPCGYQDLVTIDMHSLGIKAGPEKVQAVLTEKLSNSLSRQTNAQAE